MTAAADPGPRWGIVADDLTGAADSAVGFADAGWPVLVLLDAGRGAEATPPHERSVLATSTGVRGAEDDAAERETSRAVAQLRRLGTTRLFLKIDSAGRGSIAAQIRGALSAWGAEHPAARALVCPAYPRFGRQVRDGHILIDGSPLAGSATAHDPVSPRDEGDLTRIVPGARLFAAHGGADPARITIVDAEDDAGLELLAENLGAAPPETVAVGSGGLAAALGRVRPGPGGRGSEAFAPAPGGRVVVAVSSQHPLALAQIRELAAVSSAEAEILQPLVSGTVSPEQAAEAFAGQVAESVGRGGVGALVLVGGDGAAAALRRLGAAALRVEGSLLPGCPLSAIVGGAADGLIVVTKSGGFGTDGTLREIARRFGAVPPRNV